MDRMEEISLLVQQGRAKNVKELVAAALEAGDDPQEILSRGLMDGISIIGGKFKNNEVYVPEVLVAARAMNAGMDVLKPVLTGASSQAVGKAVLGTVKGDLHDIGKNLVKIMLEGKGIEVIDLGTDVAPEAFIDTAIEQGATIVCCSALLTTTMNVMQDVVKTAEAKGVRDKLHIMVGGAPVSQTYCDKIGADAYTPDAASASDVALGFLH